MKVYPAKDMQTCKIPQESYSGIPGRGEGHSRVRGPSAGIKKFVFRDDKRNLENRISVLEANSCFTTSTNEI